MTLSRRSFLSGLGLGGIAAATPFAAKAFLDVGLATRQGNARFKPKGLDSWRDQPVTRIDLKEDEAFLWVGSGDPMPQQFVAADPLDLALAYRGDPMPQQFVAADPLDLALAYRDTYIDRTNGQIWTVNPATGESKLQPGAITASLRGPLTRLSNRELEHTLEELAKTRYVSHT